MSLKGLFKNIAVTKIVDDKTAEEIGRIVESADYHKADIIDEKRYIPLVDFSEPKNFAKYGSAEKYYEDSFTYVSSLYPYDGSLAEKLQWKNSGSYLDIYIFDKEYPRTNGYISLSYDAWGTPAYTPTLAAYDGYGIPNASTDYEYISANGGPGLGGGPQAQSANIYDPANNRESNLEFDLTEGVTVECWLKKSAFNISNTEKEVLIDLWNNELSSSNSYGRFRLELTGTTASPAWTATVLSGSDPTVNGFQWQTFGTGSSSDIADDLWHHYAFSFLSASAGVTAKYYIDGSLQTTENLGTVGINKITGSMQAYIGALITKPSGSTAPSPAVAKSGKMSASLDEFRYWKTQRSSEKIGKYWFTQVGGGTNTDLANTDLGVYYKFNEGITTTVSVDSVILDYSGRVSNGTWTGYSSGARNTGSAMVESSASAAEFKDPIIYAAHPDVKSKLATLKLTGSVHDNDNSSQLFSYFPSWMQSRDIEDGSELKKLTQVMSSYFDTLYLQVEDFANIKNIRYVTGSVLKENTLGSRLLASKGLLAPELFLDADILEQLGDRSLEREYRDSLANIKNSIYQNIYNNLSNIYKSKGTRQSFRNLLRCFGVDEKIFKLNVYGNNVQYDIRNNRELYSSKKRYVDFSVSDRFDATLFQQTSSLDSNTVGFITGSSQLTGGFATTLETYVQFPHKPDPFEKTYSDYEFNYLTSSLFGVHTVDQAHPELLSWNSPDNTNFQVYAIRDEMNSTDACFILSSSADGLIPTLSSSYYDDVYSNTNWVFAVTVKPEKYPLVNYITGSHEDIDNNEFYIVEFKGTQVEAGAEVNSFFVSASVNCASVQDNAAGFVTGSKRAYVGAHRQNFTGSVLHKSDVRVGFCRYWLDDVPPSQLVAHGMDIHNYGTENPSRSPYLFQNNLEFNIDFVEEDTLALNWDFETLTGSNSTGTFAAIDFSSGSTIMQSEQFGILGDILGAQHSGYGYGFPINSTSSISVDYVLASEIQDFEKLNASDMISVLNVEDDIQFTRESRPINYLFAIEKSMNQTISENMIKMFSVINDFNNIIGAPVNKYRDNYKQLRVLRQKFFDRVGNTPDLDKYVEYYKWFDSALSKLIEQLIPASAEFSKDVRTVVESHILERNKYQFRFPTMDLKGGEYSGDVRSPLPLSPGWRFTHHPVNNQQDTNSNYWKSLASRDKGLLKTDDNLLNANKQITFDNSVSSTRARKERNIYRFVTTKSRIIKAGNNYSPRKVQNYVFPATAPWGPNIPYSNVPENIMLSFASDVEDFKDTVDILNPSEKKRMKFGIDPTINKSVNVSDKADGNTLAPFSLYSSSTATGYNAEVSTYYSASVELTNLHEDIVGNSDTRPLQGPFTEKFVGGRQYRHTELNDGNDTRFTRAEGFRLQLGGLALDGYPGALGIVPPNYPFLDSVSGSAPRGFLPELKTAHRLRDESAKRPVNIKNILMTTASAGTRLSGTILHSKIGNYSKNYQVVQTAGRTINDPFFQDQSFDFASNPLASNQTIRGRFPLSSDDGSPATPNVGFVEHEIPQRTGSNSNKTIFVNKFSAPGGYSSISPGYLDPAHEEKSVYNVLPYRNLSVLDYGTFESASFDESISYSMHVEQLYGDEDLGLDRGLKQRLMAHNARFGYDGVYPARPAYYKVNRNRKLRVEDHYNSSFVTASVYDNWFSHRPIPRSEQQYSWITASMDPEKIIYGYSELSGGYFVQSLPLISSSYLFAADGSGTPVGVADFVGMNRFVFEPLTGSTNTLGYPLSSPLSSYKNTSLGAISIPDTFNTVLLNRNGPYGWSTWKQIRVGENPVVRNHKKNSILSVRTKTATDTRVYAAKGNTITQFTEPQVYSSEIPIVHKMTTGIPGTTVTVPSVFKSSFGNKLIHLANYEANNLLNITKDYQSSDLYFNRINSMILKDQNNDATVAASLSHISAIYAQTVYPATYNANLNRTRARESYTIADIWDNTRTVRSTNIGATNSQGARSSIYETDYMATIVSSSIWPLDGHNHYETTSSVGRDVGTSPGKAIYASDGAGELQNGYSRYFPSGSTGTENYLAPAATYASRLPLGSTGSFDVFGGDVVWQAGSQSGQGLVPYKTYEQYAEYLRLVGKDYSIVPEFRISNHVGNYILDNDPTSLTSSIGIFDLTGSAYEISSETGFYKTYANSDFMKMFEVVQEAYEGQELVDGSRMSLDTIALRCNALCKFLPYKGFYPAERTLELATLLSQSYGDSLVLNSLSASTTSGPGNGETTVYRALLEPLFAPGIMYNTIKSGLAVSNFVVTCTASAPLEPGSGAKPASVSASFMGGVSSVIADNGLNKTALPEGDVYFEKMLYFPIDVIDDGPRGTPGSIVAQGASTNGFIYQKVPFEAIQKPSNYLSSRVLTVSGSSTGRIYDNGLGSASLEDYNESKFNYVEFNGSGDKRYEFAVDNFLCETVNFFENGLTSISSKREDEFKEVLSGSAYSMTLTLHRPLSGPADLSGTSNSAMQHPPNLTGPANRDAFEMYRRVSAFGPPLASVAIEDPDTGEFSASYSHLTPPYFAGTGSAHLTFTAPYDGRPALADIFANTIVNYTRHETTPLYIKNAATTKIQSAPDEFRVNVDDSVDLFMSLGTVPAGTTTGVNRWLMQSKFESPILNFANFKSSIHPPSTDMPFAGLTDAGGLTGSGMWHTFGEIPSGSNGVFATVTAPRRNSLADIVGIPVGTPQRIGEIKQRGQLQEAVVAIPFVMGEDGRRKFYKLQADDQNAKKSIMGHLGKYVFPPRFDFMRYKEMDPVAMYVFEFGLNITQEDLARMWQNLPPSSGETFTKKEATIQHKLLKEHMLNKTNRKITEGLRWLVFKVKIRAQQGYDRFKVKNLASDPDGIPSYIGDAPYSYNWPYDYFSLVELVKIDEALGFESTTPTDSTTRIIGTVNVDIPNPIITTPLSDT